MKFGDDFIDLENGEKSTLRLIRSLACTERSNYTKVTDHKFEFAAYWISKVGWIESKYIRQCIDEHGHRLASGPILDNGGGHGKDSFYLKKIGFEPFLIDLNSELLKKRRGAKPSPERREA